MTFVSRLVPSDGRPCSLAEHRAVFAVPPRSSRARPDLIEQIRIAGLTGRGGASFPTAQKLTAVTRSRRTPVVVINGCESEPASDKDKALMRVVPHLVLDGAALAAAAVGANRVVMVVERDRTVSTESIRRAIAERAHERALPIELVEVPQRFVSGEETALVHHLNGGDAKPTTTPPRVFERGVDNRPTFVANVETVAHMAQITRFGPDWFREIGPPGQPGSMLVTLSGAVASPGVYEVPIGMTLRDIVRGAGGATRNVGAILVGGYYGTWIHQSVAHDLPMSNQGLRAQGAAVGCGALVVFPEDQCGLRATAAILGWLAGETAQQCGPCMHGLPALARGADALANGAGGDKPYQMLLRWSAQIEGRGGCRMPDGAVRMLRSALAVFADDVTAHARGRPCGASANPSLLALPQHRTEREWR